MAGFNQNLRYQGTARGALASGVAQMQIVNEFGRTPMRGTRVNEEESLVVYCESDGAGPTNTIDLSAKFERVEGIFAYNLTTATPVQETNPFPTVALNHQAKVTFTAPAALNDRFLLTVVGKLLSNA